MHTEQERRELADAIDWLMEQPVAPMPHPFPRPVRIPSSNPPDQPASGEYERED